MSIYIELGRFDHSKSSPKKVMTGVSRGFALHCPAISFCVARSLIYQVLEILVWLGFSGSQVCIASCVNSSVFVVLLSCLLFEVSSGVTNARRQLISVDPHEKTITISTTSERQYSFLPIKCNQNSTTRQPYPKPTVILLYSQLM